MTDPAEELAVIKVAYANCVNDLARAKAQLKRVEDMLYQMTDVLRAKADEIQIGRIDNPGSAYVGR